MSLRITPGLVLPLDAVTQTFAILAKRGAGKSNAAAVMAEAFYDAEIPFVVVDPVGAWWGLRASRDGKGVGLSVPIFGGHHGDVPLEPSGGKLVADLIVDERLSCVLDVGAFDSESAKRRFLADFAERLFSYKGRPGKDDPLHLFLEEADDYAPQKAQRDVARSLGAFQRIVKQGRARGLGATMITQRSAVLNKDLLTQIETLVVMRTTAALDRKAIAGWVEYHDQDRELLASLSGLEDGEAWVWSPWLKLTKRVRFPLRRTFDSAATPSAKRRRAPARLADVDLDAIRAQMAETIERAKSSDPRELQARVRELERKLANAEQSRPQPEPIETLVEVPRLSAEQMDEITKLWIGVSQMVEERTDGIRDAILELANPLARIVGDEEELDVRLAKLAGRDLRAEAVARSKTSPAPPKVAPSTTGPTRQEAARPTQHGRGRVAQKDAPEGTGSGAPAGVGGPPIKAGARRMMAVLAPFPDGLTRAQLGTLAGVTQGGTFSTYLNALKANGYVEESNGRVILVATPFATWAPAPTTAEIVEMYRRKLKAGARRMLDVLLECYPEGISPSELGDAAGVTQGGTFSTYLNSLVRNGLAEKRAGAVYAGEALFLGGR